MVDSSVADEYGATDEMTEMDFWDGLVGVSAVSNRDALHALVLTFVDKPPAKYADALAVARERRWIRKGKELPPRETARVGWIARAICIEGKIEGGLTMRIFGPKERYAVRELSHLRWLPEMSENQALSGLQLIAVLSKLEDHLAGGPETPREDM